MYIMVHVLYGNWESKDFQCYGISFKCYSMRLQCYTMVYVGKGMLELTLPKNVFSSIRSLIAAPLW